MNGLWTVEFGSSTGSFGGGVVVLNEGKILGGDSLYYYEGEYVLEGRTLRATLRTSPFIEGAESVFKTKNITLTLRLVGSLTDENHVIAQGQPDGMPNLNFGAKLTKRH